MSRDAAHDEIVRMCNGGSWRMTVPVDDRRDSDIILSRALDELTAERDRARDLAVALEQQVAAVEALRDRWRDEMVPRGEDDQLYTAGVVALLGRALGDES